jgi:hypothetical protein
MFVRFSLLLLLVQSFIYAQPTTDVISRTLRIQTKYGTGTTFSIDVDGREYWITAAHVLTGAPGKPYGRVQEKTVEVQILNPGGDGLQWIPTKFTVLQPDADVDIVVLVPEKLVLTDEKTPGPPASSQGMIFGGPCEFLGYPLGGGWRAKWDTGKVFWMPYIKHCTVSGMDSDTRMWVLDGINNHGFSGGPVITGTGADVKFVAVISGYVNEPALIIRGNSAPFAPDTPPDYASVNSGFIIAYDIGHAVDLIKKHPIGPLRPTK